MIQRPVARTREFGAERKTYVFSTQGQKSIQTTPRGGDACGILLIPVQIEVAGEQQDGREDHGQGLERPRVLSGDKRREQHRRHGIV